MNIKPSMSPEIALRQVEAPRPGVSAPQGNSFESTLMGAVGELSKTQVQADDASTRLAHGAGNLHEVALAMEKADVTMRLAVKVRNKVVEAYQDVMRMGV
jgi:flagellar hook-basal body complex protein FliE